MKKAVANQLKMGKDTLETAKVTTKDKILEAVKMKFAESSIPLATPFI